MGTLARASQPDIGRELMARPPETPDSLTPGTEWARPIDPDAADRRRYARLDGAASPDLRVIVECAGDDWRRPGRNADQRPGRVETRRVVRFPQSIRHPGPVPRIPCGLRAVGRRPSRPAA